MTLAALAAIENGEDPVLVVTPADQTVADAGAFNSAMHEPAKAPPPCRALGGRQGYGRNHLRRQKAAAHRNQSTYIPLGKVHRLANPGTIPLEIIEVQSGGYLGEDDIVRFTDNYGRA